MMVRNSVQEFYHYLLLQIGLALLNIRIGKPKAAFEIINSLMETLNDKERLAIEYSLPDLLPATLKEFTMPIIFDLDEDVIIKEILDSKIVSESILR